MSITIGTRDLIHEAIKELDIQSTGMNRPRKYVYHSSTPTFNVRIFIEQFFRHLFFPLSDLLMYYKYQHSRPMKNQSSRNLFFDAIPHLYWMIILLYSVFHEELRKGGISNAEVIISLLTGITWRLVVSSKYASMSHEEYINFLTCESDDESKEMQSQMQLITGWINLDLPFCAHETRNALGRMGFYCESESSIPQFRLSRRDLSSWSVLIGKELTQFLAKGGEDKREIPVTVSDLLALIIYSSQGRFAIKVASMIVTFFAVLFGLLPGLLRVSCPSISKFVVLGDDDDTPNLCSSTSFFGDGGWTNFFSALLLFHNLMMANALNYFFVAAIAGSLRQYNSSVVMSHLVRVDTVSLPLSSCPVLDLKNPNNIRAWIRARLALHFFGMRYGQRIDLYTKLSCTILIVLLVWLYVHSKSLSNNGGQPNVLLVDIRYWTVAYTVLVWGALFSVILAIMAATNFELIHQEIEFLLHRLTVRETQHREALETKIKEMSVDTKTHLSDDHDSDSSSEGDEDHIGAITVDLSESSDEEGFDAEWYEVIFGSNDPPPRRINTKQHNEEAEVELNIKSNIIKNKVESKDKESKDKPQHPHATTWSHSHPPNHHPSTPRSMTMKQRIMSDFEVVTESAKSEELDDLLDTVVLIVEAQSRVDPRRFLGIDTSWSFVVSFLVGWATLIGITLNVAGIDYSLGGEQ